MPIIPATSACRLFGLTIIIVLRTVISLIVTPLINADKTDTITGTGVVVVLGNHKNIFHYEVAASTKYGYCLQSTKTNRGALSFDSFD